MLRQVEVGRRGFKIASRLWPTLRPIEEGSESDRNGQDAVCRLNGLRVQVKADSRIAQSGNLYLELYEKTAGRPDQPWRCSPAKADVYIFVTKNVAYWVPVDSLAKAIVGSCVKMLTVEGHETSIGLLIPVASVNPKTVRAHNLWDQHLLI